MEHISIKATDLQDAWFQAIYNLIDCGRKYKINKGSFEDSQRIEFDYITIQIEQPYLRVNNLPIIPEIPTAYGIPNPVSQEYMIEYLTYIMTSEKHPNEDYTYGERLWKDPNQVEHVIQTYKDYGFRNNQMVLQIAQPSDIFLNDPPCLRHIDTRIQDKQLHFFIYFRSWDLWSGFPANLAGLSVLQEYMAQKIRVNPGKFICSSKGLHVYDYAEELVKIRCGVNDTSW